MLGTWSRRTGHGKHVCKAAAQARCHLEKVYGLRAGAASSDACEASVDICTRNSSRAGSEAGRKPSRACQEGILKDMLYGWR